MITTTLENALFAMNLKFCNSWVYARPNGGRIKLPSEVIASIHDYVQNERHKPEAGGVMLGRYIIDSIDIVIDKISFPMPGDRATRTTFFRKKRAHQLIINREWEFSSHTCTYLGEWHTHPEPYPSPSCIDNINWKRKLKNDVVDSDSLFFLIVGTSDMRMWEGHIFSRTISLLKSI
jgi:integrative and conjugative element protein (TIGR02256 family)